MGVARVARVALDRVALDRVDRVDRVVRVDRVARAGVVVNLVTALATVTVTLLAVLAPAAAGASAPPESTVDCHAETLFLQPLTDSQRREIAVIEQSEYYMTTFQEFYETQAYYGQPVPECYNYIVALYCAGTLSALAHNSSSSFFQAPMAPICASTSSESEVALTCTATYQPLSYFFYLKMSLPTGAYSAQGDPAGCYPSKWLRQYGPPPSDLTKLALPDFYAYSPGSPLFEAESGIKTYYRQLVESSIMVTNASKGYAGYIRPLFQTDKAMISNDAYRVLSSVADQANAELLALPASLQCGVWTPNNYSWQLNCFNLVPLAFLALASLPLIAFVVSIRPRHRQGHAGGMIRSSDILLSRKHKADIDGIVRDRKTRLGGLLSTLVLVGAAAFLVWILVVFFMFNRSSTGTLTGTAPKQFITFTIIWNMTFLYLSPSAQLSPSDFQATFKADYTNAYTGNPPYSCATFGNPQQVPCNIGPSNWLDGLSFTILNDTYLPKGYSGAFLTQAIDVSMDYRFESTSGGGEGTPPPLVMDATFLSIPGLVNVAVVMATDFSTAVWSNSTPRSGPDDIALSFFLEPVGYSQQVSGEFESLSDVALLPNVRDGAVTLTGGCPQYPRCHLRVRMIPVPNHLNFYIGTTEWSSASAAFTLFVTTFTAILSSFALVLAIIERFTGDHVPQPSKPVGPYRKASSSALEEPLLAHGDELMSMA